MSNNFSRDFNTHKHKKEKIVDAYLIKEEKKYVKELIKKVEHFEKVADVRLGRKRQREVVKEEGNGVGLANQKETEESKGIFC
jgi:hypothetical protein